MSHGGWERLGTTEELKKGRVWKEGDSLSSVLPDVVWEDEVSRVFLGEPANRRPRAVADHSGRFHISYQIVFQHIPPLPLLRGGLHFPASLTFAWTIASEQFK